MDESMHLTNKWVTLGDKVGKFSKTLHGKCSNHLQYGLKVIYPQNVHVKTFKRIWPGLWMLAIMQRTVNISSLIVLTLIAKKREPHTSGDHLV